MFTLALVGVVAATTTESPCSTVPLGEYYAPIGNGKYLYLEVDSGFFKTSLKDFAETSDEESDVEGEWIRGAPSLVSRVEFSMKADCVAEIADASAVAFTRLLVSLSRMIGLCIHPGGLMQMKYDPVGDELRLGCLPLYRAVDGVVKINQTTVIPKEDIIFVPRGVFVNAHQGQTTMIRIVDRQRMRIRTLNGERDVKVVADYFFKEDGQLCVVPGSSTDWGDLVVVGSYFHKVAGVLPTCFTYSSEKQMLKIGSLEFKFEGVIRKKPVAV